MTGSLTGYVEAVWYGDRPGTWLRPLGAVYAGAARLRRRCYLSGPCRSHRLPVPVWIVGNLTVGGAGKTPLVAWLARTAVELGYYPGILSRGYGGRGGRQGVAVDRHTDPRLAGDEPVLLAERTGVPVRVDRDRVRGGRALVEGGCDLILCDDGLQHYRLARDTELVVADGERGFGNGRCLPAGPLREPLDRLASVDCLVWNGACRDGYGMSLRPGALEPVGQAAGPPPEPGATVHAIAGIGHPQRFFRSLSQAGYRVIEHPFGDHHPFRPEELEFGDGLPVIMTSKDAVKCRRFAPADCWMLPVEAVPDTALRALLTEALIRVGRASDPTK